MRDRWVAFFAIFCLAQLPFYVMTGRGALGYDAAIKAAETGMAKGPAGPADLAAITASLDDSEAALKLLPQRDSRRARLDLNRASLAWHQGKMAEADAFFRAAIEGFEKTHGWNSFHTSAVSLRYAEFLMLTRRYDEALPRFEQGTAPVEETMGPKNAFATRMVFRRVTLLTYMNRLGEAKDLALQYLPALQEHAGKFDEFYLTQTAGALDTLTQQAGLDPAPGGGGSWRQSLLEAQRLGKERQADSSDEG